MNKNIVRTSIAMVVLGLFFVGCSSEEVGKSNAQTTTNANNVGVVQNQETKASSNEKNQDSKPNAEVEDCSKWNGKWIMGGAEDQNKMGPASILIIKNSSKDKFEFFIDAAFKFQVTNSKNEKIPTANVGQIEGVAKCISSTEAEYTADNLPDYKIIFKILDDKSIEIQEINTKTGKDYGSSYQAGNRVRYIGKYIIKK